MPMPANASRKSRSRIGSSSEIVPLKSKSAARGAAGRPQKFQSAPSSAVIRVISPVASRMPTPTRTMPPMRFTSAPCRLKTPSTERVDDVARPAIRNGTPSPSE